MRKWKRSENVKVTLHIRIPDRNHMQFCSSKMIWPGVALQGGSYPFQVVDMWHNKIITSLHTLCDTDPTHTLLERRPVIIAKVTFIYSAGEGWCSLNNEFVHAVEHIAVIGDFQMDQHLMWNFHKEKVCLEQNIFIGSFHASFHNFHNVYVKWPREQVVLMSVKILLHQPVITTWFNELGYEAQVFLV